MGLTPWRVTGLIVIAAVCVAFAVLDATSPASHPSPPSCKGAKGPDSSREAGLLSRAESAYGAILAQEPSSICATRGMKEVAVLWCARGDELRSGGATLEAVKAYTEALDDQPFGKHPLGCAVRGLHDLGGAGSVTDCKATIKPQCIDLIVNVNGVNGRNGINGRNGRNGVNGGSGVNGRNGYNGVNGRSGVNGRNGFNGVNGRSGVNGRNGRNGANGRNGYNGANGRSGRNGANGRNGYNGANGRNGRNGANGTSYGPCGATGCS